MSTFKVNLTSSGEESFGVALGEKIVVTDANYNSLVNKPTINGTELSGDLTTEDLNLGLVRSNTTDYWDSQTELVADKDVVYVYTDYKAYTKEDGAVISYPGIKIGDGVSLLSELSFVATEDAIYDLLASKLDLAGGTMSGSIDMGLNKITNLSNGVDDRDAVTVAQLRAAQTEMLRPSGSIDFASLPPLEEAYLNNIYNVTDAFVTTSDFVEGSGNAYLAGTNVSIINVGTAEEPVYKYNTIAGKIDTSIYVLKTDIVGEEGSAGIIRNGSSVTDATGLTACPIINGVPYYKEKVQTNVTVLLHPSNWRTDSVTGYYYQTREAIGVTSDTYPSNVLIAYPEGTTLVTKAEIDKSANMLLNMVPAENSVTVYACERPTASITLVLVGV